MFIRLVVAVLTDAGLQRRAQQVWVVGERFGRVDELLDDFHEAVRVIVVRHVSGLLEDLKTRTGDLLVGQPSMAYGDDQVVRAPDDLQRKVWHQIAAVQHRDELAARVDHRS